MKQSLNAVPAEDEKQQPTKGIGLAGMFILVTWSSVLGGLLFLALGYGVVMGGQWYSETLLVAQPVAWYAWPWSWPGPTVVEKLLAFYGGTPHGEARGGDVLWLFSVAPRIVMAAVINFFVALLPLFVISFAFRAWLALGRARAGSQ